MSPSIPGSGGAAAQVVVRRSVEDGPSSDVRPRRRRAAAHRVYSMDLEEPPLVTTVATSTTVRSRSRTSSFGSTASSSQGSSSRGSTRSSNTNTNPRVAELRNYVNQCKANYERYKQAPQHQKATLLQKCVDDLSSQRSGMHMSRSSSSLSSRSSMDEDYYEKNHVEEEQATDSNPILHKVTYKHHNQSYSTASTLAMTLASSASRLHEALRQSLNLSAGATGTETSSPTTPPVAQTSSSSRRYELREQQPSQDQQQRPPYFNASIRMQSSSMGSSISSLHSSRSSLSSTNNNNGRRTQRRPPQQIPDSYFSPEAPLVKPKLGVVAFDGGVVPPPPPLSSPRVRITTPQEAQFHKRLQQIAALNQPYHQEQQQQAEEQEQGIEVEAPLALRRPQPATTSLSLAQRGDVVPMLTSDITPQSPKQQNQETTSTQVADPKGDELDTSKDQIEIPSEQPKTKQKSKSRLKRWFASCKCQSSASPETTTKNGSSSTPQQSQLVDVQDMLYLHQGLSSGKYHGQIDFITGLPHGQGSFECSKCSYNGAWKDGKFDTTTAASNDKSIITSTYLDKIHNDSYQGAFQDNKYHGQGTLSYGDGRVFTGTFDKGSIARGTMSYTDGSSYQGAFKDHKRHDDHGLYLYPDGGSQYKGSFVNDAMQGHGSMVWKSGTKYVGEFQNSVRHGLGREFDASGNVLFEGLWKNGRPVTS